MYMEYKLKKNIKNEWIFLSKTLKHMENGVVIWNEAYCRGSRFGGKIHGINVGYVKFEMPIIYLGNWIHEFIIYKKEFFWR